MGQFVLHCVASFYEGPLAMCLLNPAGSLPQFVTATAMDNGSVTPCGESSVMEKSTGL